jgi:DNA-binding NarL/FixJ family response regulator
MEIRILLVDDHPALRLGIRSLIQQALPSAQVSEVGNAEDALEALANNEFDLVFLDMKLPVRKGEPDAIETGKATLQRIREADGPPVVVMSAESQDRQLVESIMQLGAATWVPKTADLNLTLEAIRRALSGGIWLPPEMIGKGGTAPPPTSGTLLGPLPKPVTNEDLGLTRKEFEVLRLALNGLTPIKIASVLGSNHDNIRKCMGRLYEKFGTANQASLHAYFAKSGLTLGILKSTPKERC